MRRVVSIILFAICLCVFDAAAAKKQRLEATIDYVIPESESQLVAKRQAVKTAKAQALRDVFGSMMIQNQSVIQRVRETETSSDFLSIVDDFVKGEWLEDIEEPKFEFIGQDRATGRQVMRVTVKGYGRELTGAGTEFISKALRNGTDIRCESDEFVDGDALALYFKTPVDGYVTVYLLDETTETVYCLLPYQNSGDGVVKVKHDRDYIFFAPSAGDAMADELVMTCSRPREFNDIYVIFSPNEYSKAIASNDVQQYTDSLVLPRSLSFKDFKTWLVKYRNRDNDMSVNQISLMLSGK